MIEERNHILVDGGEVVDLIVPDTITPLSHRPAAEVPLELREDDLIALGDVETEGYFPRCPIVAPRTERDIETPLAIREASQVVPDVARHRRGIEHDSSLSC